MRCPACKERVIDFLVWGRGPNAFRAVDCPHCGTGLKASWRTVLVFALVLALMVPLVIGVAHLLKDVLGIESASVRRAIFGAIIIPLAFAIGYLEWRTGSYVLRNPARQQTPEGGMKH